ncbi:MAG: hypothetical protein ACT4QF_16285 [Sporichthyaceae bacterium]
MTTHHHRAVAGLGETVATFDGHASVGAAELIKVGSAEGNILAVHLETLKGEPLAIGRVIRLRKSSFELHYVGRDGVWARQTERWKYRDLTRIELGGRYLQALNRFADPYRSESS